MEIKGRSSSAALAVSAALHSSNQNGCNLNRMDFWRRPLSLLPLLPPNKRPALQTPPETASEDGPGPGGEDTSSGRSKLLLLTRVALELVVLAALTLRSRLSSEDSGAERSPSGKVKVRHQGKTSGEKVSHCLSEISGATETELAGREQSEAGAVSASCFHPFRWYEMSVVRRLASFPVCNRQTFASSLK